MKVLFIVQGEGRGHMTQSIAMQNILTKAGHEVCEVLLGKSPQRKVPDFYYQQIKCQVTLIDSPNFVTDAKMKAIKMIPSVTRNLAKFKLFRASLKVIKSTIQKHQPDLIINFYDPLMGLYYLFNKVNIPMVCIAHQYLFNHKGFKFPAGHLMDSASLKFYTSLTAVGAYKKLALSFYPFHDEPTSKTYIVPPLLREAVFQKEPTTGDFILAYLVNAGYMEEIIDWHNKNPETIIHCFMDKALQQGAPVKPNLYFHAINDQLFLEKMSQAKGLITTAGFESVCEAMYLNKPVFMVPVEGHFEQFCNSRDAFKAGAGIYGNKFELTKFLEYLQHPETPTFNFQDWVRQSETKLIQHLTVK